MSFREASADLATRPEGIATEALLLDAHRLTGIERYTLEILRAAQGPHHLIVGTQSVNSQQLIYEARQRCWEITQLNGNYFRICQLGLGWHIRSGRQKFRGIHHFSLAPGVIYHGVPFSLTVHDVSAWKHPETMSSGMKYLYKPLVERALRLPGFRGIVTVSRFSKEEIASIFNLPSGYIKVVYPPLSYIGRLAPKPIKEVPVKPFYLHVGTIEPRKNLELVISAFQAAALRDTTLYLVGRQGWQKLNGLPRNVRHLSQVDDQNLAWLYRNATALISASMYEGFGLPVAEALGVGGMAFVRDIPVYNELYAQHVNCYSFRSQDELVSLMKAPPLIRHGKFDLPLSISYDNALWDMYG